MQSNCSQKWSFNARSPGHFYRLSLTIKAALRVARSFAGCHDFWKRSHPMVELPGRCACETAQVCQSCQSCCPDVQSGTASNRRSSVSRKTPADGAMGRAEYRPHAKGSDHVLRSVWRQGVQTLIAAAQTLPGLKLSQLVRIPPFSCSGCSG